MIISRILTLYCFYVVLFSKEDKHKKLKIYFLQKIILFSESMTSYFWQNSIILVILHKQQPFKRDSEYVYIYLYIYLYIYYIYIYVYIYI